jgi:hypothetical protein
MLSQLELEVKHNVVKNGREEDLCLSLNVKVTRTMLPSWALISLE